MDGARLEAAGLHFGGAVAEVALAVLHEGGALGDFVAGVMAGVGEDGGGHEGGGDCEGAEEMHGLK